MKSTPELAQRLSEVCVKIMLAALVLSALAFGLAEKFHDAAAFEAFAKYEIARETLDAQVSDLQNDPCWQRYIRAQPREADAAHLSLLELNTIQCSDQSPNQVAVGITILDVPPDNADPYALSQPSQAPAVQPSLSQPPRQDMRKRNDLSRRPMPPTNLQVWIAAISADQLVSTLHVLWDDALLATAKKYSAVAAEDIYRWELFRLHLQTRADLRRVASGSSGEPASVQYPFSQLRISDLEQITRLAHGGLGDLDRVLRDNFRAFLPETSMGVRIGTAAQVVSAGLAILMTIFAAYIRAAINAEAVSTKGTVFSVLIGSRGFEIAGLVLICIPAASLASLTSAIDWPSQISYVAATCALIVFGVTTFIALRIVPFTGLNVPLDSSQ
jgi:hypothetical protein